MRLLLPLCVFHGVLLSMSAIETQGYGDLFALFRAVLRKAVVVDGAVFADLEFVFEVGFIELEATTEFSTVACSRKKTATATNKVIPTSRRRAFNLVVLPTKFNPIWY